jgi:hypothetical protein
MFCPPAGVLSRRQLLVLRVWYWAPRAHFILHLCWQLSVFMLTHFYCLFNISTSMLCNLLFHLFYAHDVPGVYSEVIHCSKGKIDVFFGLMCTAMAQWTSTCTVQTQKHAYAHMVLACSACCPVSTVSCGIYWRYDSDMIPICAQLRSPMPMWVLRCAVYYVGACFAIARDMQVPTQTLNILHQYRYVLCII